MDLIIIAGMPASGKSTLAERIGKSLGFPILEKDAIKEELFDTVGFECYAEKRRLDVAANAVLLRCADAVLSADGSLIVVNNFRDDMLESVKQLIERHRPNLVTVFLGGNSDVFYQRYADRDRRMARHAVHAVQEHYPPREGDPLTYVMTREEFREKFEMLGMDSFDVGGERIDVDATYPEKINAAEVIQKIRSALRRND